jgi:hypothetical protein
LYYLLSIDSVNWGKAVIINNDRSQIALTDRRPLNSRRNTISVHHLDAEHERMQKPGIPGGPRPQKFCVSANLLSGIEPDNDSELDKVIVLVLVP